MANLIGTIDSFRSIDLQLVLRAFKQSTYGRKKELRDRVVKLLGDPGDPDPAVLAKIEEVASRCDGAGFRGRRPASPKQKPLPPPASSAVEMSPVPRGRSQRSAAIVARNQLAATASLAYDIPRRAVRDEVDYSPSPSPESPPRPSRNFAPVSPAMDADKNRMNGTRGAPPASKVVVRLAPLETSSVTITASANSGGTRNVCVVSSSANVIDSIPKYTTSSNSTMNSVYPSSLNSWQSAFLTSVGSSNAVDNFNKNSVTITPVGPQSGYSQQRSGMVSSSSVCNNWSSGLQPSVSVTSSTVQISKNSGRPQNTQRPIAAAPPSSFSYSQPQSYPNGRAREPYSGPSSSSHLPLSPDVKMEDLPFYPVVDCLMKPTTLVSTTPSSAFEKCAKFSFTLTPQQSQSITQSLVRTPNGFAKPGVQIQLRFCKLETSCPQKDFFPPNLAVSVNNGPVELPKLIHSTQAGIPPKRPPAPLDITSHRTYSHAKPNQVTATWQIDPQHPEMMQQQYAASVWLVKQLSAAELVKQLRTKGAKDADFTRAMIKEKLRNDEDEVAMTFLRVSLTCPLGKCRMQLPCRSTVSCTHLQCFDANFFVCMNEKKPSWLCPVCDKEIPFRTLVLDGYFMDVIKENPPEDMIELHLDGTWSLPGKKNEPAKPVEDKFSINVPSPGSTDSDGICVLDVKDVKPIKSRNAQVEEVNLCSSEDEDDVAAQILQMFQSSDDESPLVNGSPPRPLTARPPRIIQSPLLDLSLARKRPSRKASDEDSDSSVELSPSKSRTPKRPRRIRSSSEDSCPISISPVVKKDRDEGYNPQRPVSSARPDSADVIEICLSSDED